MLADKNALTGFSVPLLPRPQFQLARQLGHHGQHLPFAFDGLECLQDIFLPGVQIFLLSGGAGHVELCAANR